MRSNAVHQSQLVNHFTMVKKRSLEELPIPATTSAASINSKQSRISASTAAPAFIDDEMGEFEDAFEDTFEEEILHDQTENDDNEEEDERETFAYLPGTVMGQDEVLQVEKSAYDMLHEFNIDWPCLSFDFIIPPFDTHDSYPKTVYAVAGTQAENKNQNKVRKRWNLSPCSLWS